MGNLTRRLKRQQRRSLVQFEEMPALSKLALLAGRSLGLTDEQSSEAIENLGSFPESEPNELADMVLARLLEMVELVRSRATGPSELQQACATIKLPSGRVELERRNGSGFVTRVAAMGRPAVAALVSVGLAVLLMLWPSAAKAAQGERVFALRNAHKIQRRNSAGLLAFVRKFTDHFLRRGWIRLKKYYATSPRRSLSRRRFAIGCAAERVNSRRRGRRSKSSWCGGSAAFVSGDCLAPSPTSQLSAPTARSRGRHGANPAKEGSANANA